MVKHNSVHMAKVTWNLHQNQSTPWGKCQINMQRKNSVLQ